MTPIIRANVEPTLLSWARESIGYSVPEAARKIRVPPERLLAWERGEAAPTINQLRKAANVYKRPLAVFYLPEPPRDFFAVRDFRTLPEVDRGLATTPALNLQIRLAHWRRQVALEIAGELGLELRAPELTLSVDRDPESQAGRVRELLSIDLATQFAWGDQYEVLNGWLEAVESQGIFVFQTSDVDITEMRGFSISEKPLPIIVINAQDFPRGRVFSILHELGHILLNAGGLCDLHDSRTPRSDEERIEVFCNHLAGAVLVPQEALSADPHVRAHGAGPEWSDRGIRGIANRFGVSQEVVVRRLLALGRTTRDFYEAKRREYQEIYRLRRREQREGPGFAPYHKVKARDLAPRYTALVLDAYHQETISSSDLSDFLGVRLRHVPRIERELFGTATIG